MGQGVEQRPPGRPREDIAVVAFAQKSSDSTRSNEAELLMPVIQQAVTSVGLTTQDMGFVVSGSSDYAVGRPFSFVSGLDAVGAWPPLQESHVEMDGAFALFEAYLRLQHGDIDTALVYSFALESGSDMARTMALQLEPYTTAPLFIDMHSMAALQARAALSAGTATEQDAAEALARSLRDGAANPHALRSDASATAEDVLAQPTTYAPLRDIDLPPVTDSCAVVVLAAGDRARELTDTPVWITGIDHRIEAHALGLRELAHSVSTRQAAEGAGVDGTYDLAELHAPYAYQELIVRSALGLNGATLINPSGGAICTNGLMAAGVTRIGEAASRLAKGDGERAIAHAHSGPCLQQNLVATLEVRP